MAEIFFSKNASGQRIWPGTDLVSFTEKANQFTVNVNKLINIFYYRSITVGALTFGALWSTIMIGFLADTFGRKRTLMCNNVIVVLFCILMTLAFYLDNYILMIVARFVIGINAGYSNLIGLFYTALFSLKGSTRDYRQCIWTRLPQSICVVPSAALNNYSAFLAFFSLKSLVSLSFWALNQIGTTFSTFHWSSQSHNSQKIGLKFFI